MYEGKGIRNVKGNRNLSHDSKIVLENIQDII
jgi:hypothetical protein